VPETVSAGEQKQQKTYTQRTDCTPHKRRYIIQLQYVSTCANRKPTATLRKTKTDRSTITVFYSKRIIYISIHCKC